MAEEKFTTMLKGIVFLVLFLSVVSFLLSWTAINRTGATLEGVTEAQIEEMEDEAQEALLRAEVRARLFALKAELAVEEFGEESVQAVQMAREDIETLYSEAKRETSQELQEIDRTLDKAEVSARQDTAEAIQDIQRSLEVLQRDIQTDE